MLILNFRRMFLVRGIQRPFSFLVKQGYSGQFATRVANNHIRELNLNQLEKLCVLLNCTPNDLLQWIPSQADQDNLAHPLTPLRQTETALELTQLINCLPVNKLTTVHNFIKQQLQENKE